MSDIVAARNCFKRFLYVEKWEASGEFIQAAYALRRDDDDWSQARTLVRKVMDDAARNRLVSNVVGHLKKGVSAPVLTHRKRHEHRLIGESLMELRSKRLRVQFSTRSFQ